MSELLALIINYIVPASLIFYGIYFEIKHSRIRKKQNVIVMLNFGGWFAKGVRLFHWLLILYNVILTLLWILSFIDITSFIQDIHFKYVYLMSFGFIAVSCTMDTYILRNGVLIGDKIYPFSEMEDYAIHYDDTNNSRAPYSKKVSIKFKGHKRTNTYWINRDEINKFTELMGSHG